MAEVVLRNITARPKPIFGSSRGWIWTLLGISAEIAEIRDCLHTSLGESSDFFVAKKKSPYGLALKMRTLFFQSGGHTPPPSSPNRKLRRPFCEACRNFLCSFSERLTAESCAGIQARASSGKAAVAGARCPHVGPRRPCPSTAPLGTSPPSPRPRSPKIALDHRRVHLGPRPTPVLGAS